MNFPQTTDESAVRRARSLGGLAVLLLACVFCLTMPPAGAQDEILTFVQITDTHIGRAPENAQRLQRLIEQINRLPVPPAAVVHTGDIIDYSHYENALQAKELLARLGAPLLPLPGNNDLDRQTAETDRQAWQTYFGPLSRSQMIQGVRFVLFCSEPLRGEYVLPDYDPLAWLERELREARERAEPVLLFLHAPPVEDFYANAAHAVYPPAAHRQLLRLLAQNPPAAVIAGHFHRDEAWDLGAYRVYVAPPVDDRWGRQAAFRIYSVRRNTGGGLELSYSTQYENAP